MNCKGVGVRRKTGYGPTLEGLRARSLRSPAEAALGPMCALEIATYSISTFAGAQCRMAVGGHPDAHSRAAGAASNVGC